MTNLALHFSGVAFAYRGVSVFEGLDLKIRAGEMTAVLGPNGSGKTTLLRLASGGLEPRAGRIEIFDRPLASLGSRQRARTVAVVPQETALPFDFTVREVVLMGRSPHLGLLGIEGRRDREIAEEAMRCAEVLSLADRPFTALSGGERQRVILARALAQKPRCLLLDEPTAFLDLKHRLAVYTLLSRLNAETGLTVVAASHDVELAGRFCRRLVLLRAGAVEADGSPAEVLTPWSLRTVYEVEADVLRDAVSGAPLVVPRGVDRPGGAG